MILKKQRLLATTLQVFLLQKVRISSDKNKMKLKECIDDNTVEFHLDDIERR
jgi:hypothetical protein